MNNIQQTFSNIWQNITDSFWQVTDYLKHISVTNNNFWINIGITILIVFLVSKFFRKFILFGLIAVGIFYMVNTLNPIYETKVKNYSQDGKNIVVKVTDYKDNNKVSNAITDFFDGLSKSVHDLFNKKGSN